MTGAFRVIYVAKFADAVFVLHCFEKKSQRTSRPDIELATRRYKGFGQGAEDMSDQRFANIWDAIESDPGQAENMKLRSRLMMALRNHITQEKLGQAAAAKLFGVTQPRISDLVRGKIDLFSLDTLVNMLAAAGLHIELQVA